MTTRWIDAEKRKPKTLKWVLACDCTDDSDDPYMRSVYWDDEIWVGTNGMPVTHWMPLPPLPKRAKKGNGR